METRNTREKAGGHEDREIHLLIVEHDRQFVIEKRRNRQRNRRRQRARDHVQTLYASLPRFSTTSGAARGRAALAELGFSGEIGGDQRDADAVRAHSLAHAASVHAIADFAAFPAPTARRSRGTVAVRGSLCVACALRSAELRGFLAGAVGAAHGVVERAGRQRRAGSLDETLAVPAGRERNGQAELGGEGVAVGAGAGLVGEDAGAVEALVCEGERGRKETFVGSHAALHVATVQNRGDALAVVALDGARHGTHGLFFDAGLGGAGIVRAGVRSLRAELDRRAIERMRRAGIVRTEIRTMRRTRQRGQAEGTACTDIPPGAQPVVAANVGAILAAERRHAGVRIGGAHAVGAEVRLGGGADLRAALRERLHRDRIQRRAPRCTRRRCSGRAWSRDSCPAWGSR